MIIRDLINNCGVDRFVKMTEDCRGAHEMSRRRAQTSQEYRGEDIRETKNDVYDKRQLKRPRIHIL